jgi:hypothetical protein
MNRLQQVKEPVFSARRLKILKSRLCGKVNQQRRHKLSLRRLQDSQLSGG